MDFIIIIVLNYISLKEKKLRKLASSYAIAADIAKISEEDRTR